MAEWYTLDQPQFFRANYNFMAALQQSKQRSIYVQNAWRIRFFFVSLILTVVHAAAFPAIAANPPAAPATVMVYGDSLSAAYGIKPEQGWVALMEKRLAFVGIRVINASISGETSAGGLGRIKTDLARHRPDTVILALGANDGLRGLPVANLRRNLEAMIGEIQRAGGKVILVGIQIPPNYGIQYTTDFKNVYRSLASERRLTLVPFLLDGIAEDMENFQTDRLHPGANAQARILQNVLPVVQRTVRQHHQHATPKTAAKP